MNSYLILAWKISIAFFLIVSIIYVIVDFIKDINRHNISHMAAAVFLGIFLMMLTTFAVFINMILIN